MLGQDFLPNEKAALSQDVVAGRRTRFLWTALGFAFFAVMGLIACAFFPLASHISATPSHDAPAIAFIPTKAAILGGGIRSAMTGRRPVAPAGVKHRHAASVPHMSSGRTTDEAALASEMLILIDKWSLDEDVSKPFKTDDVKDACLVPIELDWLNEKLCSMEECPLDLRDSLLAAWERVEVKGEGCVTVNALKEEIRNPSTR